MTPSNRNSGSFQIRHQYPLWLWFSERSGEQVDVRHGDSRGADVSTRTLSAACGRHKVDGIRPSLRGGAAYLDEVWKTWHFIHISSDVPGTRLVGINLQNGKPIYCFHLNYQMKGRIGSLGFSTNLVTQRALCALCDFHVITQGPHKLQ